VQELVPAGHLAHFVRDLVRAHGGSVRLTARPDGGTGLQVTVILPAGAPS